MNIRTIEWQSNKIKIIDQTKLPAKLEYLFIKDVKGLWKAIRNMKIRGAPALGAAAGLGLYLGIKDSKAKAFVQFNKELDKIAAYIASSRPTARNLFWALAKIQQAALRNKNKPLAFIKKIIYEQANQIIKQDMRICRKMGYYGAGLVKNNDCVLTICNAGILATIDYGTALGVIYQAHKQGKNLKVFVCETRPMLQGARLTTWELKKRGIKATLICDSMAATLMQQGKIYKVITGADRIAANGDTANKIGTYNLAVLSKYHKIPFYVVAPSSTFDLKIKTGGSIPIEERKPQELTHLFFKTPIVPSGISVFNPAFDVTPHQLITAIITEKGIIKAPDSRNIIKKIG